MTDTTTASPWTDEAERTFEANRTPAIYAALNSVQSRLGSFAKEGVGPSTQGSYPFLRVDDIIARLSPALVEEGVIVVPRQTEVEQTTERFPKVNMDGNPIYDGRPTPVQIISKLRYEFDFIAIVDGSKVTAVVFGESIDTGDKGIRRAATAAYKEALLRMFTIVTGEDDPDALNPNDVAPAIARQDRGEQMREKATTRARKGASLPTKPDPEPETKPEPAAAPAAAEAPKDAPAGPVFTPDPADVAYAEQHAPAAKAAERPVDPAAPADEPVTPVKPQTPTADDNRAETLQEVRKQIRLALEQRDLPRDIANKLGDAKTGKPRAQWFANIPDLRMVLKAIEAGEMPAEA